jgi:hypothetical protein
MHTNTNAVFLWKKNNEILHNNPAKKINGNSNAKMLIKEKYCGLTKAVVHDMR